MWPASCIVAIQKIKTYSKPELQTPAQLPLVPVSFSQSELQLRKWKTKVPALLSSPSWPHFQNWIQGTEEVLIYGQIKDLEHAILEQQVQDQRYKKINSRRTLQTGGALTAKDALRLQAEKQQKEVAKQAKQAARALKSQTVQARKLLKQARVKARKEERARRKVVAGFIKAKQAVPDHLLEPIPDPEVEAEANAITIEESSEESGNESSDSVQFFL